MIDHEEREQNIIGMLNTVMMRTEDINQVHIYASKLSDTDFKSKAARIAFDHIKRAISSAESFDSFTLKDWVNSDPRCREEMLGGIIFEACHRNVASYVSLGTNIKQQKEYANKVRSLNYLEQLNRQLSECDDIKKIAGQAASFFEGIAGNINSGKNKSVHITEVAGEYINQLQEDIDNPDKAGGLTTGFSGLDNILGTRKMQPGTLMVIGARPGMGKTALMTYTMVTQAQVKKDKSFIAYSLEMPRVSLYERIVKDQTGYSYEETLEGDSTVFAMVTQLTSNLKDTQLYMNDSSNMSIEDIEADAREQAKERDVGGIFVDYLTIMQLPKKDRHDLSIGEITRRLKKLSGELNCCVILLAQLNRSIDDPSRKDKRPVTKDLRDSGSIEQDADYILFPYRDVYYDPQSMAGNYAELILRKNRHGKSGTAYAQFIEGRFKDCDQDLAETRCKASENNKQSQSGGML